MELTAQLGQEMGGKDRVVVSSKSKRNRATPDKRPSPPKNNQRSRSRPPNPDRRKFLGVAGVAAGAALLALFGKLFSDSTNVAESTSTQPLVGTEHPTQSEPAVVPTIAGKDKPYMGWEQYLNREMPQEFIFRIGEELINSDYPGFPKIGDLVVQSQLDYASVPQVSPKLTERVKFVMGDLLSQGALSTFTQNVQGIFRNVSVEDIQSGQTETTLMVAVNGGSTATVGFDNYVTYGSPAMRRLLVVKEMSSFLYMDELRQHIVDEVSTLKRVDVPPEELADFLMVNGYYAQASPKPSGYGYYFDNILKILDGAGYWYVLPAFAEGIRRGDLTDSDIRSVTGEALLMKEAIARGLFILQPDGSYAWKEGITPFNKDWIDLVTLVS